MDFFFCFFGSCGFCFCFCFFLFIVVKPNTKDRMTCNPENTYDSRSFKYDLYDNAEERNWLFGYDKQNISDLQMNYHNTFLNNEYLVNGNCQDRVCDVSTAPKDYYYNLPRNENRAVIGQTALTPNLYDDVFRPDQPNASVPNFSRTWKPFTTSAQNLLKGCSTTFVPNERPVEIAPRINKNFWTADLNSKLYERSIINSAQENPYLNFYHRQGMINLLAQNMRNTNDPYTVPLTGQTFDIQLQQNNNIPPVTIS